MAPKRPLTPPNSQPVTNIWLSKKTKFSDSMFMAAFSSVLSYADLKRLPVFSDANHKIGAWRMPSKQRTLTASTTFVMGHEDDGERGGGQALVNLLLKLKIDGCIVVARWFGGTMIGPRRWTMIDESAREAILKWSQFYNVPLTPDLKRPRIGNADISPPTQRSNDLTSQSPATASLVTRPQDPVAEHRETIADLKQRDENIPVLRQLLADMRRKAGGDEATKKASIGLSPAKPLDYSKMPLAQLRRLLAARDATIKVLLDHMEQIEKQEEAEQAELDEAFIAAADKIESNDLSPNKHRISLSPPHSESPSPHKAGSFFKRATFVSAIHVQGSEDDPEMWRHSSQISNPDDEDN